MYGLKSFISRYDEALEMILSSDIPRLEDFEDPNFLDLYGEAMDLYGLVHARFILTEKGLDLMKQKFIKNVFGSCPRILCDRQSVLPFGMSEKLCISRVKIYCPKCNDIYIPQKKFFDIDGAYFGCSFPHIFLQTFPDLIPKEKPALFIPKIYGFNIFGEKVSKYKGKTIDLNTNIFNNEDTKMKGINYNENE